MRLATRFLAALVLLWCGLFAVRAGAQDRLIFALDIIRHGDRTPTSEFPGVNPKVWPEGLGELTPEGTNQEYELGRTMRSFYQKTGLLESDNTPETICAISTDLNRTKASGRLFLNGLLGTASAKIPLRTQFSGTVSAADLLIPTDRHDYKTLLTNYVYQTPEWLATNAALQPRFAEWGRLSSRPIASAHDLIYAGDTFYIHQLHHIDALGGLGSNAVQSVIDAGRWALVYQYQTRLGQITGQPLIRKIAEYLTIASEDAGKPDAVKYVLISAHDSTLMSALAGLRAPLAGTNSPPYAAWLHFGLFQTPQRSFYLQIIYHDQTEHQVCDPDGNKSWSVRDLIGL